MRKSFLSVLLVLLLIASLPMLFSNAAWASDSIQMRSGRALSLDAYAFEPRGLRIVQHVDGGTLGVRLAYRSIEPASLDALFRLHAATSEPAERMRLAALAVQARVPHVGEDLYASCVEVPSLREAAHAGGLRARRAVAVQTLDALTQDVAAGQGRGLLRARMATLAASPYGAALTAGERMRLRALERLIEPAPLLAVALKGPPGAPPAPADVLSPLRAQLDTARTLRDRAADPTLRSNHVQAFLDRAALSLRRLRKALKGMGAHAAATALEREVTDLLASTLVDLAEEYRQAARFDQARAHVRSALLFRPEHPSALQQRGLIESDIASLAEARDAFRYDPYRSAWDPYRYSGTGFGGAGFDTFWVGPSIRRSAFGYYRPLRGTVRGFSVRHHFHHDGRHHRASSGRRRAVGTRR